jgi:hypothetical protein
MTYLDLSPTTKHGGHGLSHSSSHYAALGALSPVPALRPCHPGPRSASTRLCAGLPRRSALRPWRLLLYQRGTGNTAAASHLAWPVGPLFVITERLAATLDEQGWRGKRRCPRHRDTLARSKCSFRAEPRLSVASVRFRCDQTRGGVGTILLLNGLLPIYCARKAPSGTQQHFSL